MLPIRVFIELKLRDLFFYFYKQVIKPGYPSVLANIITIDLGLGEINFRESPKDNNTVPINGVRYSDMTESNKRYDYSLTH